MKQLPIALIAGGLALSLVAAAAQADPLVMGPTPIAGGTYTAFDASNSANQLIQNNTVFISPPFVWTENLIANGPAVQQTSHLFGNLSFASASCATSSGLTTSPLVTSLNMQIDNSVTVDPVANDSLNAYAGASMFYTFTITQTATISMAWSTVSNVLPSMQTVMFWDISGINPAVGSVAGSSGVDSGLWTGTFAPGEYSMIYTRHDGITASSYYSSFVTSTFVLTATIPTPGAAAAMLLGLGGLAAKRRRSV